MYDKTIFNESPLNDIENDLKELKKHNPQGLERLFLINGDVFTLPAKQLITIANLIHDYFPSIETISCYASIRNIKTKTDEDLDKLSELGFNDLYIGLESANNAVLKLLNKGYNRNDEYVELEKLFKHNMRYNALIMLGAGGKEYSDDHITETVDLLNEFKPKIVAPLSTTISINSKLNELVEKGVFTELTEKEMLLEELYLLENLNLDDESYFFGNHKFNRIPATGYFKHKQFIVDYIKEEMYNLEKDKPELMNSKFNTYPIKTPGFLLI